MIGGTEKRVDRKPIGRCVVPLALPLPMDIIEGEILCRLPVKSLLRFKSVCKRWYSFIQNPSFNFMETHHHHQNHTPLFLQRFRDQHPMTFNPSIKQYYSIWPIPMASDTMSFSYYLGFHHQTIFLRPANGVSLIVHPNKTLDLCRMALFNPATRQFCKLPLGDFKFHTLDQPTHEYRNHIFGFGVGLCNPLVCKVVWLNLPPINLLPLRADAAVAKVYTVGRDEDWRIVNAGLLSYCPSKYTNTPTLNICVNGKCYWLSRELDSMLVFDMEEEVFREMNIPSHPYAAWKVVLSEVQGCTAEEQDVLALFVLESDYLCLLIMNKDEEWRWLRLRVPYVDWPLPDLFVQSPHLVQYLGCPVSEAILLTNRSDVAVLYNPKTSICVRFRPRPATQDYFNYSALLILNFKESFFSLEGGIQISDRVLEDFKTF